jgi:leader peptidase (prepilin peptidase)/N-methyltransferase
MFPIASLAFVGGLMTGSFVGLVAHRVPRGDSIVGGRSVCDSCGVQIAAYDNVPVFSWLILRGRCRSCGERIPLRYLLIELALGAAFAVTAVVFHDDPAALALGLVFVAMLAAITLTDLERRVIPNKILIAGAVAGFAIAAATDPSSLPERGIAALAAGGLLFLIALAYPRGMGMGDVKLAFVLGVYLGRAVVPAMFAAFVAGALIGAAIIARMGVREGRKAGIPFGPWLALGGIVGLLAGDEIVDWYLDTFT